MIVLKFCQHILEKVKNKSAKLNEYMLQYNENMQISLLLPAFLSCKYVYTLCEGIISAFLLQNMP